MRIGPGHSFLFASRSRPHALAWRLVEAALRTTVHLDAGWCRPPIGRHVTVYYNHEWRPLLEDATVARDCRVITCSPTLHHKPNPSHDESQ